MEKVLQKIKQYEYLPEGGIQYALEKEGFKGNVVIDQLGSNEYLIQVFELGKPENWFVEKLVKEYEVPFAGIAGALKEIAK